jgi:hypothetical protein
MNSSVIASPHDPRRRPPDASNSLVVLVDDGDAPRLSDYKDIFIDHRWLILGVLATILALGAIYVTLARPIYRGNLLIQIEEPASDEKGAFRETSGLFEIRTPVAGELQVLGSCLVVGGAVDDAALRVVARPHHPPVVGYWLSTLATGLSTPGFLGLDGYVTGRERIEVKRFSVPADLENDEPFVVTAQAGGRYVVRHRLLDVPLEGQVGVPLRAAVAAGAIDIELSRLDALPGGEFRVAVASRLRAIEDMQTRLQLVEQGRQHHVRAAVVVALDALRDIAGVGDEMVDAVRGAHVPLPQRGRGERHQRARHGAGRRAVLGIQVPDIAHGRMAVADVHRLGAGNDALGRTGLAGDDQVVVAQVEGFQGIGHQRQHPLVVADPTDPLQERRRDAMATQLLRDRTRFADQREDVRIGIEIGEHFQHLLASTHTHQPVMNQGDSHAGTPRSRVWR